MIRPLSPDRDSDGLPPDPLADLLADLLSSPPADPLAPARGAAPAAEPDPVAEALRLERLLTGGDPGPAGAEVRVTSAALPACDAALAADVSLAADLGRALLEAPHAELAPALRAAARQAFASASVVTAPAPAELAATSTGPAAAGSARASLRVLSGRAPARRPLPLRAFAALLLAGLGLLALLGPREAAAEPELALAGLDRFSARDPGEPQLVASGSPRAARLGERFEAAAGELLQLRLLDGGRVVLASGRAVDVASAPHAARGSLPRALLRLASGEALLDTREGPVELLLVRAGDGRTFGVLSVEGGPAHVAAGLGPEGEPALALLRGGRARFTPASGPALDLRGPAHVVLSAAGQLALGEPALALFRELELLGGPLPAGPDDPFVDARRWRVLAGQAQRGGEGLRLRASPGAPTADGAAVRLAWVPDASVAAARTLRLALAGPAGLEVALPALGVTSRLPAASEGAEPGLLTLELPLPAGWSAGLPAEGLALELRWPAASASAALAPVRFDGACFAARPLSPLSAPRRPAAAPLR